MQLMFWVKPLLHTDLELALDIWSCWRLVVSSNSQFQWVTHELWHWQVVLSSQLSGSDTMLWGALCLIHRTLLASRVHYHSNKIGRLSSCPRAIQRCNPAMILMVFGLLHVDTRQNRSFNLAAIATSWAITRPLKHSSRSIYLIWTTNLL